MTIALLELKVKGNQDQQLPDISRKQWKCCNHKKL